MRRDKKEIKKYVEKAEAAMDTVDACMGAITEADAYCNGEIGKKLNDRADALLYGWGLWILLGREGVPCAKFMRQYVAGLRMQHAMFHMAESMGLGLRRLDKKPDPLDADCIE